jgi:L-ascorbate metabolism protein UlaG (beta-lactamase superfamily)
VRITIAYLHHNCFLFACGPRTLLFDPPAPALLPAEARSVLEAAIRGADLVVLASHGHPDHFDPEIARLAAPAARARFVLSDDIADLLPESVPEGALVAGPDEEHEAFGLTVRTFESNDLGLAFLLRIGGAAVYFGGDLACWDWESAAPAERDFSRRFFAGHLARLAGIRIDAAFSNLDRRLVSLAGGLELARTLRPGLFVPMHCFGEVAWLADLPESAVPAGTDIFRYARPGDSRTIEAPDTHS